MPDTDPKSPWSAPSGPPIAGGSNGRDGAEADRPAGPSVAPNRRWATVGGLGAGLIGGVTAGLVFGVPSLSGASDAPSLVAAVPAQTDDQAPADERETDEPADSDSPADGADEERQASATERIRENLQPLVDDGTLDAAQADAVAEHLAAEAGSGPFGRHRGHGPLSREIIEFDGERGDRITERLEVRTERMDEIAEALGVERDDLVDRLLDGETLADVAEAQGVALDDLVDVLIADRVERIDQAVADGEMDAEEAEERKAALEEMATAHLEGDHPAGPRGRWEPRDTDDETTGDETTTDDETSGD